MLPDRVSNPGPLTYKSGALPIALRGPAAFDRVWHKGLLYKLQSMGITGRSLLQWFTDYLHNRKRRVVLPGGTSDWTTISAGVPQGSIHGPLLFLVYINDIVEDIN